MAEKKLKPGWRWVKLGDVVRQCKEEGSPKPGERYIAGEHMDTDDLKIRRWGTAGDGYLGPAFHRRFHCGQVLYGSRRTYLRKVAVADFDGICANTTYVLESKDPRVLAPELLPFIMQTEGFAKHSVKQSRGSVNPYINFSDIAWFEFALPPLDEQRRLTGVLDQYLSTEESYRHLLERADQARSSAVENLFAPEANGWQTRPIGELFDVVSGGTPSRGQKAFWGGDIPWVKTGEINYSWIHSTEEFITKAGLDNSSAKLVPRNSVVMALFGQGPTLGRVARLGIEAATNQACAVLLPNTGQDQSFLFYFLWRQYRRIRAMARGASQPNLNLAIVKSLEFPVISLENQKRLAGIADVLVTGSSHARGRLHAVRDLRARLVQTALGQG